MNANGTASCTITNTLNSATFMVHKDFSDSNASAVSMSLTCGASTVVLTPMNATGNPDNPAVFTVTGVPIIGTTCTATELTTPTGYTKNETACASIALSANGTASCIITNTLNSATITVTKTYSDSSATAVAGFTLTCTGGGTIAPSATQSRTGGGTVSWTVTGFSGGSCSVSESTVPAGYAQASNDCTTANLGLTAGATKTCTIANTLTAVLPASATPGPTPNPNPPVGGFVDLPVLGTQPQSQTGNSGTNGFGLALLVLAGIVVMGAGAVWAARRR